MNSRYKVLLGAKDMEYANSLFRQLQRKYADKIIVSQIDEPAVFANLALSGFVADILVVDIKFWEYCLASENSVVEKLVTVVDRVAVFCEYGEAGGNEEALDEKSVCFCRETGIPMFRIEKYSGVERIISSISMLCGKQTNKGSGVLGVNMQWGEFESVSEQVNTNLEKGEVKGFEGSEINEPSTNYSYQGNDSKLLSFVPVLREEVNNKFDFSGAVSDRDVIETTKKVLTEHSGNDQSAIGKLSENEKKWLAKEVFNSIKKLDILQDLLDDENITEIMINGYQTIFVERNNGINRLKRGFEDEKRYSDIIQRMVSEMNKIVNEFSPIVDLHLEDGSRVNIVLPPIALDGPVMTIRKFPHIRYSLEDLVRMETLTEETAQAMRDMVRARCNIFISGGTGSGKTTLLNALASEIPRGQRIVTIEDSAELCIQNVPNLVRLETKNANSENKGAVKIEELIRTALRMRPDRIIVGEVRGEEVFSMLQAMNTGHDGSFSTGHANSALDMISRLEAMGLMAAEIPLTAIRKQIIAALDILVHITRMEDGIRRISEISEIVTATEVSREGIDIGLNTLFALEQGSLRRTVNPIVKRDKYCLYGLDNKKWMETTEKYS